LKRPDDDVVPQWAPIPIPDALFIGPGTEGSNDGTEGSDGTESTAYGSEGTNHTPLILTILMLILSLAGDIENEDDWETCDSSDSFDSFDSSHDEGCQSSDESKTVLIIVITIFHHINQQKCRLTPYQSLSQP
jgi:hypothetical protein